MQAVVLAAGQSQRFYPYNTKQNKAFLRIFGKTILEHTLLSIQRTGINEIIAIVSNADLAKKSLSQDVKDLNIKFVEQKDPQGMGDALLQAKDFINEDFFVLHATHPDFHEFYSAMVGKNKGDVLLLTKHESRTKKYGILKVEGDLVLDFTEKPEQDSENLRVIGIYLMSQNFLEVLSKTPHEHYSFEKAIASMTPSKKVFHVTTNNDVVSLKFVWDLFGLKNYLLKNASELKSPNSEISPHAIVEGKVVVEEGAKIMEGAVIKGENYIGKNSIVGTNAIVRDGTVIGDNCTVGAGTEVKNTIMFDNSTIHSGFLGDSIIGSNNKIAALFLSTNKRIDRESVKVELDNQKVDTYLEGLGVITGDEVNIGGRVTIMPGVIVGNNVTIGPGTNVMKNVSDNSKFFATFKENVEKKA